MLTPHDRSSETLSSTSASVFQLLGGELSAVDTWTRVDMRWLHDGATPTRDAVGYAGLPMSYRVAGLTIGDADAAPAIPPFCVQISPDRLIAQAVWVGDEHSYRAALAEDDPEALRRWAAGSLTKSLSVIRFPDGDTAIEADLYFGPTTTVASLREFVTAFSWDVAALHACQSADTLLTTEDWVKRAAISISRSTPSIPLRDHAAPEWHSWESPRGVFCSLQPGGGLCESDNVLYAVSRDAGMLQPVATMPGHRNDWDCSRFIDVWRARNGATCFARSLLGKGFITIDDGEWHVVDTRPVTSIATWGADGFLLGLHDGHVELLDGAQRVSVQCRLARVTGRFARLVSVGDRAIALIGSKVISARIRTGATRAEQVTEVWDRSLELSASFDDVCEMDVDGWSTSPGVAVLSDDAITILDADTGTVRSRFTAHNARQAKWIGPGWLLVMDLLESRTQTRTRVRVLDVVSARWTEPVVIAEVSRLAVRGDEIQVGFANQSIAVWDRLEVCRGIGATAMRSDLHEPNAPAVAKPPAAPIPTAIDRTLPSA